MEGRGIEVTKPIFMKITDLIPDRKNANKGTRRGAQAVTESLRAYGAGRSILIDAKGRIIAGNKTAQNANAAGIDEVLIIQSDGTKIIAVQRIDLDLDTDSTARALAIADNRTAEIGLSWDAANLAELSADLDLSSMFTAHELSEIILPHAHDDEAAPKPTEIDVDAFTMQCKCPKCGFEFDPPSE